MMISSLRKSLQRDESGQAIILGAVMMLVLAVGIMTTAQLGWAIKERIQLQHAADNAAYSNATMVARSMNFIAWTNRAMISQYVSAMSFQSFVSYLDGINMVIAAISATIQSVAFVLGTVGRILSLIPFTMPVGEAMLTAADLINEAGTALESAANTFQDIINGIDKIVGPLVMLIGYLNKYINYWVMQQLLGKGYIIANMFTTAVGSTSFYKEAMTGTAGEDVNKTGFYDPVSTVLQAVAFSELFNENSEKRDIGSISAGYENKIVRAEFLMAELVNASREGNKNITFESNREFAFSTVFKALYKLITKKEIADGFQKATELLDDIFPKTVGGSLLAGVVAQDTTDGVAIGTDNENSANLENNPVFTDEIYRNINKPLMGRALISEQYTEVLGGTNKLTGLVAKAINFMSFGGEIVPTPKRVGIQATNTSKQSIHCRFSGIYSFKVDVSDLLEKCNDACSSGRDSCEANCEKKCDDPTTEIDESGNETETGDCNVDWRWESKPGAEEGECDNCAAAYATEGEDSDDCPAAVQCRESAQKMMEQINQQANDIAGEVSNALVKGRPAQVGVMCYEESKIHKFAGVTQYVSYNIERHNEKQIDRVEAYPTFFAAANKKPSFMKNGALGFGDNFNQSKKFKMSSVGKVGGHERLDTINDAGKIEADLLKDEGGYNYNHMDDDERSFLGAKGFHAWAASQVYYHRPGTWAEPPNLFNPFWKPKLSPVTGVLNTLGLEKISDTLSGYITDGLGKIITH